MQESPRKASTLHKHLDAILHHCNRAGHRITNLSTNEEFEPLLGPLQDSDELKIKIHFAAAQAHVPPAERNHRFVKERIRGTHKSESESDNASSDWPTEVC